jgi:hypothetical protein
MRDLSYRSRGDTEKRSGIQALPLARLNVLGTTSFSVCGQWVWEGEEAN